jgi:hypothetical protein
MFKDGDHEKSLLSGAAWRKGNLSQIQLASRYVKSVVTRKEPEPLPNLPPCTTCNTNVTPDGRYIFVKYIYMCVYNNYL